MATFRFERHFVIYGAREPVAFPEIHVRGENRGDLDIVRAGAITHVYGRADLRGCDLSEGLFNGCDFSHPSVKLRGANFSRSQFIDCDFTGKGLELIGCQFSLDCLTFGGIVTRSEFDQYCLVWLAAQVAGPARHRLLAMIPRRIRLEIERFTTSLRHLSEALR